MKNYGFTLELAQMGSVAQNELGVEDIFDRERPRQRKGIRLPSQLDIHDVKVIDAAEAAVRAAKESKARLIAGFALNQDSGPEE